jgi:hypothetical protein
VVVSCGCFVWLGVRSDLVTKGCESWWLGQVCVMDESDGPCVVVCLHGLAGRLIRGGNQ